MVVPSGQLTKLTVKPMMAEIVLTRGADAVTPPVSVGQDQPVKLRIIGIDAAALAHGHVVRGIEGRGANISPCAGKSGFSINAVRCAQRIAVIFNEPEIVPVAERSYSFQVERIA